VNSAGNAGSNPDHNTLVAPADGDSVIAVGAVLSTGERANFSSVGPTTSTPPRIKPDVMAQSVSVYAASGVDSAGYVNVSGTSLSCPVAAGVAALILHARPNASPLEVADAMRATASNAANPDNEYGWGILDAVAAIDYIPPSGVDPEPETPAAFELMQNFPNPFNPTTRIQFSIPVGTSRSSGTVSLRIFDLLGGEIATLVSRTLPPGRYTIVWDATSYPSGVYFYRLQADILNLQSKSGKPESFVETRKMILLK